MRKFVLLFIFAFALAACGNSDEYLPVTGNQEIQDLQAELEAAQNTSSETKCHLYGFCENWGSMAI